MHKPEEVLMLVTSTIADVVRVHRAIGLWFGLAA
jgi:hypothetical protein